MSIARLLTGAALIALTLSPVAAQERRVATDQDVITQGTIPAPEHLGGVILLSFGQSAQVYFKQAFKSIRLGDPLTVSASPQSDHIVTFTGLAPGTTSVMLGSADGKFTSYATVTVARPIHEVKVITPPPRDKTNDLLGRNNVTVDMRALEASTRSSAEADYRSLLCNDIACQPVPLAGK